MERKSFFREPEHTPGPWGVEDLGKEVKEIRASSGDFFVAQVGANWQPCDLVQSDADALLIAAAPDLLAALKGVLDAARRHDSAGEYRAEVAALAAIAKAEK